jgi:hypothetical protein
MAANEEGRAGKSASMRPIVAGATFAARDKSSTVQCMAARAICNCVPDIIIRVFDKMDASFWVKEADRRPAFLEAPGRVSSRRAAGPLIVRMPDL